MAFNWNVEDENLVCDYKLWESRHDKLSDMYYELRGRNADLDWENKKLRKDIDVILGGLKESHRELILSHEELKEAAKGLRVELEDKSKELKHVSAELAVIRGSGPNEGYAKGYDDGFARGLLDSTIEFNKDKWKTLRAEAIKEKES